MSNNPSTKAVLLNYYLYTIIVLMFLFGYFQFIAKATFSSSSCNIYILANIYKPFFSFISINENVF